MKHRKSPAHLKTGNGHFAKQYYPVDLFATKSPVSPVQFWALLLFGGSLVASAGVALVAMAVKLNAFNTGADATAKISFTVFAVMCCPVVALGIWMLRRAFMGRK